MTSCYLIKVNKNSLKEFLEYVYYSYTEYEFIHFGKEK